MWFNALACVTTGNIGLEKLFPEEKRGYRPVLDRTTKIFKKSAYQQAKVAPQLSNNEKFLMKMYKFDLFLSVASNTKAGQVAFNLDDRCITTANPYGDVALACNRPIQENEPKQLYDTYN